MDRIIERVDHDKNGYIDYTGTPRASRIRDGHDQQKDGALEGEAAGGLQAVR